MLDGKVGSRMGTLWYDGNFYTMREEGEKTEAVYTENGLIIALGKKEELEAAYTENIAESVSLQGKTVFPGFVDSHLHVIGHGESLLRLDVSVTSSKDELLLRLEEKIADTPLGEWIIGEGWNENDWTDTSVPTRWDLDEVSPHHPVVLKRACRHALVVNSKALQLAEIHNDTVEPPGGVIERDEAGRVQGILKDQAQDMIYRVLPPVDRNYLQNALRKAVEHAWSLGLTGGHTEDLSYYGQFHETLHAFYDVLESPVEPHPFRAHLLIHHTVIDEWERGGFTKLSSSPYVTFGAVKIFADGALGGRTAWLSHPYADDPTTNGVAIHTTEGLHTLVRKARELDLPIAVHTIGDAAYEAVLDAIELYPTPSGERDRLIHAQILRNDLVQRTKSLQVVLDIQPRFVATDFPWVLSRLGEGVYDYLYAWRTLKEEGIALAGGSDAPIEPVDPLLGIHAAVTRQREAEQTVYIPEERLSIYEAIELFTKGSAYAAGEEHVSGVLSPGMRADFTVLESDPFVQTPDHLLQNKVAMTVVDERIVYDALRTPST